MGGPGPEPWPRKQLLSRSTIIDDTRIWVWQYKHLVSIAEQDNWKEYKYGLGHAALPTPRIVKDDPKPPRFEGHFGKITQSAWALTVFRQEYDKYRWFKETKERRRSTGFTELGRGRPG
eukprot:3768352-Rhodomonas_salina.1